MEEMISALVNTIEEKEIPLCQKSIVYHREKPSSLVLRLEETGLYAGVNLVLQYKDGFRVCDLGGFLSQEYQPMDKAESKARMDAEKFYRKTLKILAEGNYELHVYDNGKTEMSVNGRPWKAEAEIK